MTNHWTDIQNSDCIMIIGSNAAENHPLSFKWVMKAVERGAALINVDPRFTRTSSKAHIYAPLRSGTDIAFIGGLMRYIIENNLYNEEYVKHYTDATFLVDDRFDFEDGLFSGFDPKKRAYDKSHWAHTKDGKGDPKRDMSMTDPRCVLQLLKKHYAAYTPEKVQEITGMPVETFNKIAKTFAATGKPGKSATIMYAMGTTQHTVGTQNVRSYAMLQLLLGNIGVAGGGINALRGESNVQGSTDYALLFHILPGYLKVPRAANTSLEAYLEKWTPKASFDDMSANWWQHTSKYMVSLLKAYWGDHANKQNEFDYNYLPKLGDDLSTYPHIGLFEAMYDGVIKGLLCFGQNPAVGGPNANKERAALEKLDWMVAVDLWETDTMDFWKRPGVDPTKINTEVFALPAAGSVEKEGSVVNSGRWMQWRYKAANPPGVAESDLWILGKLYKALKESYIKGGAFPGPIVNLFWNYGSGDEPDVHMVAKECNGFAMRDYTSGKGTEIKKGKQVPSFAHLMDDGSTCSGNWLYSNCYTDAGNMAARRDSTDAPNKIGLYPKWAWCWPVNRRIIYNRASVDLKGQPWDKDQWVIRWNPSLKDGKGGWEGDVPDGGWAPGTKHAFIMKPHGHAQLFGNGMAEGPFPTHYEPLESPVKNALYKQQYNPAIKIWDAKMDDIGTPDAYPIIATTYRVVEHWQAGQMTRNLPWLVELMPDVFVEMSNELAIERGIKNGDRVRVLTARGKITAFAVVTSRFKPFKLNGKSYHEIGIPWHWGYSGLATGGSANVLTPHVGDANTMIPEFKAFLCDVEKEV